MSIISMDCAYLLLKEHFGEIVAAVADFLMRKGPQLLASICQGVKAPRPKITKALCILIQHHMATFQPNKRNMMEYAVDQAPVLLLMNYPRYIYCTKTLYGEAAEILIEDMLFNGENTMSNAIEKVTNRLNEALDDDQKISFAFVQEKFESLVKIQFLQRCDQPPPVKSDDDKKKSAVPEVPHLTYTIPQIDIQLMHGKRKCEETSEDQPSSKKQKLDEPKQPDSGIYWMVNFDKFHQYMRDQLLVSATSESGSKAPAEVLKIMLCLAETTTNSWGTVTNPVSKTSIDHEMKLAGSPLSAMDLNCYLSVLCNDSNGFVTKIGENQGGTYVVNRREAINAITWATIESLVQERFGPKSLRIFRLIRLRKYLELKQIEQMSMVLPKEALELTYRMLGENFVQTKDISRTPEHTPARTFYLYHINLTHVVQAVLQWCYKSASNLIRRRESELADCKRLLEKQTRVEAILTTLKQQGADEEQLKEVQDMITAAERVQLEKIKEVSRHLELGELQLTDTIFVLQTYLRYFREK